MSANGKSGHPHLENVAFIQRPRLIKREEMPLIRRVAEERFSSAFERKITGTDTNALAGSLHRTNSQQRPAQFVRVLARLERYPSAREIAHHRLRYRGPIAGLHPRRCRRTEGSAVPDKKSGSDSMDAANTVDPSPPPPQR